MILRKFPDRNRSTTADKPLPYFGHRNVIVYARARDITYSEHKAPLSIKSTLKGQEVYEIGKVPIIVDEGSYLILNNDQPYASHISSQTEVESFCLFFRDHLAEEVLAATTVSVERLLDDPEINNGGPVSFFQKLNRKDQIISPLLDRLHDEISEWGASQVWIDQQFYGLMQGLLRVHILTYKEIDILTSARRATRVEMYRRLCRARDYMDSCYYDSLSLKAIANVACLSEYHFLRSFKQIFQSTPHQYLTEKRLEQARAILHREADRSILDICISVGFENPSSFTRLFKRRFGFSPRQARLRSAS